MKTKLEIIWKPGFVIIALSVLLFGVFVFALGTVFTSGTGEEASVATGENSGYKLRSVSESLKAEKGPFSSHPAVWSEGGGKSLGNRHLSTYYSRRAYPGAPPFIPHALKQDMSMSGVNCLGCHETGGFAKEFKSYTPITPHPEMINCRQCHVPQVVKASFTKGNNWKKISGPTLGQSALAGGPPMVPHSFQMRENCSSCHSGAGAIKEIATSHPERTNCRQCHVPFISTPPWRRHK